MLQHAGSAGRAVVATATALAELREKTGQSAMEILDIACKPYAVPPIGDTHGSCDISFDDDFGPGTLVGDLATEAFHPAYDPTADEDEDEWYDRVCHPFRRRYGFYYRT